MTDADALLAAIRAHPDEDTPRLAYADWLDEHGAAPRPGDHFAPADRGAFEAEYIRIQCRLAQHPYDAPEYPELLEREYDLALLLHADDRPRLPDLPGVVLDTSPFEGMPVRYRWGHYRRGLLDQVSLARTWEMTADDVPAVGRTLEGLLAAHPARTVGVCFDRDLSALAGFLTLPVVARLRGLVIDRDGNQGQTAEADDVLKIIAACPHLGNLRRLDLVARFTDAGLAALARARLPRLEQLRLKSVETTPAGLAALGAAPWFRQVRELELDWNSWHESRWGAADALAAVGALDAPNLAALKVSFVQVTPDAVRALARGAFPRLGRLTFQAARLREAGAEALTAARGWPLRHLNLSGCGVATGGARALTKWPLLDGLRVLNLRDNDLGPGAVRSLAACPRLAGLRHLDLSSNPLGRGGIAALARSKFLRGLRELSLHVVQGWGDNCATAADGLAFLKALDMPELRHFHLWGIPVGGRGAGYMARAAKFARLTQLTLENAALTDAATAELLEAPHLQNLVGLNLASNKLSAGLEPLGRREVLPRLAQCELSFNRPSKELAERIARRPGTRGVEGGSGV